VPDLHPLTKTYYHECQAPATETKGTFSLKPLARALPRNKFILLAFRFQKRQGVFYEPSKRITELTVRAERASHKSNLRQEPHSSIEKNRNWSLCWLVRIVIRVRRSRNLNLKQPNQAKNQSTPEQDIFPESNSVVGSLSLKCSKDWIPTKKVEVSGQPSQRLFVLMAHSL
jgi:hypothetical protein